MIRLRTFYTLISLIFMMNRPLLSSKTPDYNTGNFNHTSGVYFQKLKPAHFYHETYRIITFVDLNVLLNFQVKFTVQCSAYYPHCNSATMFSNAYTKERKMALKMLGLNTEKSNNPIFLKSLFGSFNSQDAIFYNEQIIPNSNSSILIRSVNNQTILINSTFGTSFPERTQDYHNKSFSSADDNLKLTEFYKHFDMWKLEMRTLTTAVLFAKLGKMHPEVLLPDQLMDVLKKARQNLTGKALPFEPEIKNYDDMVNISDLKVAVVNNKLIFDLAVPLLNKHYLEPCIIYKTVPFPIKLETKDLYFFIKPRADYVAFRNNDSSYTFLYEQDFLKCKELHDFRICPGDYPLKNLDSNCESALITGKKDIFSICSIKLIKSQQTIWCKVQNNAWIFSTSEDLINVTCSGNLVEILNLKNSGWVAMNKPCFATTGTLILKPDSNFPKQLLMDLEHPFSKVNILQDVETYLHNLNVSLDEIIIDELFDYPYIEPKSFKTLGTTLAQVKIQVKNLKKDLIQRDIQDHHEKEIKMQSQVLENLKDENHHQMTEIETLTNEITKLEKNWEELRKNTSIQGQGFAELMKQTKEQTKNAEDLRKCQFWIWTCICLIFILLILSLMTVFKKIINYLRRKSYQLKSFGVQNNEDTRWAEDEHVLKETSLPSLI